MYIYTYACHEDESELCRLELDTLFGHGVASAGVVRSPLEISADRSPFVKQRLAIMHEGRTMDELALRISSIRLNGATFKVQYMQGDEYVPYEERRQLERIAGAVIHGKAEMRKPDIIFGLIRLGDWWYFGRCEENQALWLKHQNKPQNYSTALPTRAARAIVNIAAGPSPESMRMVDPCCGMGTALIEAMSMGIDIEGIDMNPLAVRGARINLAHYGYPDRVRLGDMRQAEGSYDAAVVDLPYNLCSVLPEKEQLAMLIGARRIAKRAVLVATEPVQRQLELAGWQVVNSAALNKGTFTRYITVVK